MRPHLFPKAPFNCFLHRIQSKCILPTRRPTHASCTNDPAPPFCHLGHRQAPQHQDHTICSASSAVHPATLPQLQTKHLHERKWATRLVFGGKTLTDAWHQRVTHSTIYSFGRSIAKHRRSMKGFVGFHLSHWFAIMGKTA